MTESAFRTKEENHPGLPKIPVQAIGYEEAEVILRNISPENSAPTKWIGKMDAPYSLGPSLRNPGWRVRLDVSTVNERRTTFNTIGILRGSVEDGIEILVQIKTCNVHLFSLIRSVCSFGKSSRCLDFWGPGSV